METPAFYPYLSGLDNLRILAMARGRVTEGHFGEVLSMVGLEGRERGRSWGEMRRVGDALSN